MSEPEWIFPDEQLRAVDAVDHDPWGMAFTLLSQGKPLLYKGASIIVEYPPAATTLKEVLARLEKLQGRTFVKKPNGTAGPYPSVRYERQ